MSVLNRNFFADFINKYFEKMANKFYNHQYKSENAHAVLIAKTTYEDFLQDFFGHYND